MVNETFSGGVLARVSAHIKRQSGALALAIIANILLLYLLGSEATATVVLWILQALHAGETGYAVANELFTTVAYFTVFLIPYLCYAAFIRFPLRFIPHDPPRPAILAASTGVSLGLSVIGVTLSMFVALFFSMFGLLPADLPMNIPTQPVAIVLYFLNATLLPALIEEFTYRGIVLASLRPYGDRFAIVVSALLFALLHRNMTQFPNALLLGVALGYFMVKTNSIWTGMVIHFTNNFLITLLSVYTAQMSDWDILAAQGMLFLVYLVLGCAGLFYFLRVRRLDMALFPSQCPLKEGNCFRRFFMRVPMGLLMLLYGWIIYTSFTR